MEMIPCKLTKLSTNENELRTNEVEGAFMNPPVEGRSFVMFADPIEKGAFARMIATSRVTRMDVAVKEYVLHTENSMYRIELT